MSNLNEVTVPLNRENVVAVLSLKEFQRLLAGFEDSFSANALVESLRHFPMVEIDFAEK